MTLLSTPARRSPQVAARRSQAASEPDGRAVWRCAARLARAVRGAAGGHVPHDSVSDIVLGDIRGVHSVHR